jgi:hypothetical protein
MSERGSWGAKRAVVLCESGALPLSYKAEALAGIEPATS